MEVRYTRSSTLANFADTTHRIRTIRHRTAPTRRGRMTPRLRFTTTSPLTSADGAVGDRYTTRSSAWVPTTSSCSKPLNSNTRRRVSLRPIGRSTLKSRARGRASPSRLLICLQHDRDCSCLGPDACNSVIRVPRGEVTSDPTNQWGHVKGDQVALGISTDRVLIGHPGRVVSP